MRVRWAIAGLAVLAMSALLVSTTAAQQRVPVVLGARLTGAAERPEPVRTRSTGTATITVDRRLHRLTVSVTVGRIENVVSAHIHVGGPDETGPVVVTLYGPAETVGADAGLLFTRTVTAGDIDAQALFGKSNGPNGGVGFDATVADLVDAMAAGQTYINLHTTAHPGGEIRGQILPRGRR